MRMQPTPTLLALAAGALLASGAAMAQTTSRQTTPTQAPPRTRTTATSSTASRRADSHDSITFRASNGAIVTIKSTPPPSTPVQPAPAFASLDTNGNGSISHSEAAAYPALANDFGYVDSNHNGVISKSEYAHWVKLP